MRRSKLLGGIAAVAVTALGATASSASATTWSGDCNFKGTSFYGHPYTLTPRYNDFEGKATGTCVGRLNGAPYKGRADLYIDGRMNRVMSCETGASQALRSSITFRPQRPAPRRRHGRRTPRPAPTQISIRIDEAHIFTEMPFHITGAYNGEGYGELTYRNHADQQTLQDCAGSGISKLDFDLDIHTIQQLYG
jgi:hypothetical protein